MSPVFVVAALTLACRLLGVLGVSDVSSWLPAVRWATGITFIIMGVAHFTPIGRDVARFVPRRLPRPGAVVIALGVWQVLGGIGLLTPAVRGIAAVGLILLLSLKFPVNVRVAQQSLSLKGRWATSPRWRVPAQVLWIALVWWVGT